MTEPLPRIAIPEPTAFDQAYNKRSLPQYIHAVEAAGGCAVVVGLGDALEIQTALAASCSGILLPGSPADVDPKRYGQEAVPACAPRDEARERIDNLLLEHAFATRKPIFGICFGLQSLNVWKKGTLIQDLPKVPEARVNHEPGREVIDAHAVEIQPDSRLAQVLGSPTGINGEAATLQVNSSHHQAIGRTGEQLRIAAVSTADGVVEAVESVDSGQFVIAVQWHPERSYATSAGSRALFAAFLGAAAEWASGHSQ